METKEWRLNLQFDKIKYLFCKLTLMLVLYFKGD